MATALQTILNRITLGTAKAKLGDVIYDLINGTNTQAEQWNAFLAKVDTADLAGLGNNNVATFKVTTPILTPEQRQPNG
jgi:hypothetical protein